MPGFLTSNTGSSGAGGSTVVNNTTVLNQAVASLPEPISFSSDRINNPANANSSSFFSSDAFQVEKSGTYLFRASASLIVSTFGAAIRTTQAPNLPTATNSDVVDFANGARRLTPSELTKEIEVELEADTDYFIHYFAGGASVVIDPFVEIISPVQSALAELNKRIDEINLTPSTQLFDGIEIDAAPDWTDGLVMTQNQLGTVSTGIDLTTIDSIIVHFVRNVNASGADLWPAPEAKIRIADIALGVQQGALLAHFDNQFLAIDNTTEAMLRNGEIQFKAVSNNTSFGFEITRIQFRKIAIVKSPKELLFDGALNSGDSATLDNGVTWQDVIDRYDEVEVHGVYSGGVSSDQVRTELITSGDRLIFSAFSSAHIVIRGTGDPALNLTNGNFDFVTTGNAIDASRFIIYGILPAKIQDEPEADSSQNSVAQAPTVQGDLAGGTFDFTAFPPPVTGNAYIDSAPSDIPQGTTFTAIDDGTLILFSGTSSYTSGQTITVTEDAINFASPVISVT